MFEYPMLTLLVIAPFAEKVQQAERQRQAVEASRAEVTQLLDAKARMSLPLEIMRASKVPPKLANNAALHFLNLDIYFDGGSHGAEFRRHDGGSLQLFFAHPGYWSERAKKQTIQPVAVLVKRGKKEVLVEIDQHSALEKRIVELLTDDLRNGKHKPEDKLTLTRIRDCVRDRKPLKEIKKLIDPETGGFRPDPADTIDMDDLFGPPPTN